MDNNIRKIINTLEETSSNYKKTKTKLSSWAEKIGFLEEVSATQKGIWEDLSKQSSLPKPIVNSGNILSQNLFEQSEKIALWVDDDQIDNSLFTAGTASEAMFGTTVSGASISYPPNQKPPAYKTLEIIMQQRTQQEEISQRLKTIDESLANEYDNAWMGLHTSLVDETRSPMFLIREVLTRLYQHYAPDDKVKQFHNLLPKDKIKRRERIEYISSQITDSERKQAFLNEEQAFISIYDELSKAHKHGKLKHEDTKGLLYQANALIRLLLNSL